METIDGKWIKAHLTGQHGELRRLAEAVGLEPDKISKIIKGQRQIKGSEVPRFLAYFDEHILSRAPAFREDAVHFAESEPPPLPTLSNPALVRAIAPSVDRPMVYYANRNYPAAGILSGDMMVVDSDDRDGDGLVVANQWHADGSAETLIRRRSGNILLSLDPNDDTPAINCSTSQEISVIGRVACILRRNVMTGR